MTQLEPQFLEAPAQISGQELRAAFLGMQEGVFDSGDLKVTAGAGITVNVAAGRCLVDGDYVTGPAGQGRYHCALDAALNSAQFDQGDLGAPSSNPRVDQIVAQLMDATWDSSGERRWRLRVVAGTPTSGATIDNRSGAAALPQSCLRLADRHVTTAGVVTLRDRRLWARGARASKVKQDADHGVVTTGFVAVGPSARLETIGNLVTMELIANIQVGAGGTMQFRPLVDGAVLAGMVEQFSFGNPAGATTGSVATCRLEFALAAGSHLFSWQVRYVTTNGYVFSGPASPLRVNVAEALAAPAENA